MPSYRFCRPDDIPALVRAVDSCYGVHFPTWQPMTIEDFRAEMKAIDLWPSNSMMAIRGEEPIAVMLGTKRADEVMVLRIGVRPDHLRQGHGSHLLTSLSQKLAVLGPERLIAELPADESDVQAFFAACGYTREATLTDHERPAGPAPPVPDELVTPVTVAELIDQDLLDTPAGVAWDRQKQTLANRKDALEAAAIVTPERTEAWVVWDPLPGRGADRRRYATSALANGEGSPRGVGLESSAYGDRPHDPPARPASSRAARSPRDDRYESGSGRRSRSFRGQPRGASGGSRQGPRLRSDGDPTHGPPVIFFDVLGFGCRDDAKRPVLLGLLLRWLANRAAGEGAGLRMPRLAEGEVPAPLLDGMGFAPGAAYQRWAARAQAL